MQKSNHYYFLLLTIIWMMSIILVNPIGEFPLNDDWSYTLNAKALAMDNEIVFDDFGAMTLIVHTFWGAFFCKLFGFSFTTLRMSTLILGWGTSLMLFLFYRESGLKEKSSLGATLLLMFSFFFFANSFTYMTEIPFLFFFITAALFFLKSINNNNGTYILLAVIFSVLATLIRQIGVLLPLTFFFVFLLKNKRSLKNLFLSVLPFFATLVNLLLFTSWRKRNYGLSKYYGNINDVLENLLNGKFSYALLNQSYNYFVLWGLFLLPLLILLLPYFWYKYSAKEKAVSIAVTLIFCFPFILIPEKTFMGNSFVNFGVGPHVLPSSSGFSPTSIGMNDWNNLYMIGFIAAIFLVKWILIKAYHSIHLLKNGKSSTINWSAFFALTFSFGYFLFLMLNNHHIDRYSLIAFPFLILLLIPIHKEFYFPIIFKVISIFVFIVFSVFSIFSTHDYLSWNRARWKVIKFAINDMSIPQDHLNGGFEYKGYFGIPYFVGTNWEDLHEWNTHKEQYKIAFSQQCKYKSIRAESYSRYIPLRVDSMYLLQKEKMIDFDTIFCDAEQISLDGNYLLTNQKDITIKNINRVDDKSYNSEYSVLLQSSQEKGFVTRLKNVKACEKIYISAWISPISNLPDGILITDYLTPLPTESRLTENDGNVWGKMTHEFRIPSNIDFDELTFYFQNNNNQNLWIDDLTIIRMK